MQPSTREKEPNITVGAQDQLFMSFSTIFQKNTLLFFLKNRNFINGI